MLNQFLRLNLFPKKRKGSKDFINYSADKGDQWTYISFYVAPNTDVALVEEAALEIADSHEYTLHYEKPSFWVMDMGKDAVECWLAIWTKYYHAWTLRCDVRYDLMKAFRARGILSHGFEVRDSRRLPEANQ